MIQSEYPIATLKRLTSDTDAEMRKSSEELDIDVSKDRVKDLLANLMLLKKDIEDKKAKIDQEQKQTEKMRKETELLKNACQDEWQRIRAYSQRIATITNSLQEQNANPTTDNSRYNISLLVEEWANIEQTKKDTIKLKDQAQNLLEYAQETAALLETAKRRLDNVT